MKVQQRRSVIRILLVSMLSLTLLVTIAWEMGRQIKASVGYSVHATFTKMPENDESLQQWLEKQPGVIDTSVHIERQEDTVHVFCILAQDLFHEPHFPPIQAETDALGYSGPQRSWADDRR